MKLVVAVRRVIGWLLMVVSGLATLRAAWLGVMYFHNMSEDSRQRAYVAIAVVPCLGVAGAWLAFGPRAALWLVALGVPLVLGLAFSFGRW